MSFILKPWQILLACLCGMANHRQQQIIEFQNAQIEALLKMPGRKRLLLNDDQRRLLAVKAHSIGRKALLELTTTETKIVLLPPKSPNLNAYMERWFRSLKPE